MRTVAVLLLLLNAIFFAWQQGWLFERQIQPPGVTREPFQQAPQALVMLSEIPPQQRELMNRLAASEDRVSTARQQLLDAEDAVADVRDDLPVTEVPAAGDVVTPAPEVAPEPVLPWCGEAGFFADEDAARAYIGELKKLGADGALESRRERVSSVWWVHLPAFPSEAEARRKLAELKAKEIDSFYMAEGELAGGISLGVYSREASAKTAQAQLAGRGYTANIAEIDRLGTHVYVAVQVPDSALLATPQWAAFHASEKGPELTEKLCEVIAPRNVFP